MDLADVTSGYNALFGIKMILVVVTGVAAAMHQSTNKPAIRAVTGALGFAAVARGIRARRHDGSLGNS